MIVQVEQLEVLLVEIIHKKCITAYYKEKFSRKLLYYHGVRIGTIRVCAIYT